MRSAKRGDGKYARATSEYVRNPNKGDDNNDKNNNNNKFYIFKSLLF